MILAMAPRKGRGVELAIIVLPNQASRRPVT
jgi:hypothetical protein